MKKSTTSKKKRVFADKEKKKVKKKKFRPKSWGEVEREGVPEHTVEEEQKGTDKYPPPNDHPTFVSRWNEYIKDVIERENFKRGHLAQLSILCDLYVEYGALQDTINTKGYTFTSTGRYGKQIKTRPEVIQLNRVRSEIRSYSKTLGLLLVKDSSFTDEDEKEDEWS